MCFNNIIIIILCIIFLYNIFVQTNTLNENFVSIDGVKKYYNDKYITSKRYYRLQYNKTKNKITSPFINAYNITKNQIGSISKKIKIPKEITIKF